MEYIVFLKGLWTLGEHAANTGYLWTNHCKVRRGQLGPHNTYRDRQTDRRERGGGGEMQISMLLGVRTLVAWGGESALQAASVLELICSL